MEKTIAEAKQLFLEQYGSAKVASNQLRVAVVALSIALAGTCALAASSVWWAKNQKPLVIRIDEVGRAKALDYREFEYKPQERELRYFLGQFVYQHFGRRVGSAQERFGQSLYFLDPNLSRMVLEEERKSLALAKFLREGGDEVEIVISNIALQDLKSKPMKAAVDFEKVHLARGEQRELKRERYAGYFEFVVQESVPNTFILVNPLGLTITYFRADAAFER